VPLCASRVFNNVSLDNIEILVVIIFACSLCSLIIFVVDGKKAKMYLKNFGEFFLNQIEAANTVIISKAENLSEEQQQS